MSKKKHKASPGQIIENRRARHEYFVDQRFEAGVALMGWEVKALREGRVNLTDSYVHVRDGEAWLIGCNITPLPTVSTHYVAEPNRTRKLLLNRKELDNMEVAVGQKGHTAICMALYWKAHLIKAEIALAKGKDDHDKRQDAKERDWERQKQRIMRGR